MLCSRAMFSVCDVYIQKTARSHIQFKTTVKQHKTTLACPAHPPLIALQPYQLYMRKKLLVQYFILHERQEFESIRGDFYFSTPTTSILVYAV